MWTYLFLKMIFCLLEGALLRKSPHAGTVRCPASQGAQHSATGLIARWTERRAGFVHTFAWVRGLADERILAD